MTPCARAAGHSALEGRVPNLERRVRRVTGRWPVLGLLLAAACAHPRFSVPAGPGVAAPEAATAWADATARCRGLQSYSAELRVSGRAGERRRLRGTIFAGLTAAGQLFLEAPAPFGRPVFVLAGTAAAATLVTRDNQVLEAPAADVVEALVGVPLDPAALMTLLSGCGLADAPVREPTRYGDLLSVTTRDGRAFLESVAGHWRVSAVERDGLVVDYRHDASRSEVWPRQVYLNSEPGRQPALALSIAQSQIEVNIPLPESAFTAVVPPDATRLSIDDLRAAGPLGDRR